MNKNIENNAGELLDLSCGKRTVSEPTENRHIKAEAFKLYYILSGSGTVNANNVEFEVDEGYSFVVYPFNSVVAVPKKGTEITLMWLEMSGVRASMMLNRTTFSKATPYVGKINVDNFGEYFDIPEIGSGSVFSRYRAESRVLLLLSYYIEHFPSQSDNRRDYVVEAQKYIERRFDDDSLSVREVAQYIQIDRTYLYRLFKEETGMSIVEYINRRRITSAEVLLLEQHIAIKDVAFSVGFTDQMYFSRVFKQKNGVTPTEFRRKAKIK